MPKRQKTFLCNLSFANPIYFTPEKEKKQPIECEKTTFPPVSYTHLDVYKRQVYACAAAAAKAA